MNGKPMDKKAIEDRLVLAYTFNVFEEGGDLFNPPSLGNKQEISPLNVEPRLPHDIDRWNQSKLRNYIAHLDKKIKVYGDFMFENREALRKRENYDIAANLKKLIDRLQELAAQAKIVMYQNFNEDIK